MFDSQFNSHRRQFLKVGLLGSATLTLAACSSTLSREAERCSDCLWLQHTDRYMLHAIIPVMLAGALPTEKLEHKKAIDEVISGFDYTVAHFPKTVQDEIEQLLWVLQFPLTRSLIAGVWSSWHNVDSKNVKALLNNWKNSDFDLLRVGYKALHDLIAGAWYANPRSWQRIHYPGPIKLT